MTDQLSTKIAWWFWLVAIFALLWNLMGVGTFISDITISDKALQALPDVQRELYEDNPMWSKIIYGIAVFGGLLGSVGLLLKKRWAKQIFVISLIAVIIQMGFSLFIAKTPEAFGSAAYIMPVLVVLIAAFLIAFSHRAIKRGWLS